MSKYVPDIVSRRWVIISPQRLSRPEDRFNDKSKKNACPFCPGNESMSPNEVYRIGKGEKDKPGWQVRVVPNRYPVTDIHEVIIHSPDDNGDIGHLPISHVELILRTYRERFIVNKKNGQVIIFCNQGEHAGGSINHPHSQLVVVPSQINLDTLSAEPMNNIVEDDKFFTVYCPDFSQWPYEVWISTKRTQSIFGDITDEEIKVLAVILQNVLKRIYHIYKVHKISNIPFGYNFYIYPKDNWYIRIVPRFVYRAGFELGTGLNVNIVDPLEASLELKGVETKVVDVLTKLQKYKKEK